MHNSHEVFVLRRPVVIGKLIAASCSISALPVGRQSKHLSARKSGGKEVRPRNKADLQKKGRNYIVLGGLLGWGQ